MSTMDDFYALLNGPGPRNAELDHADDAAALAYHLDWVLYCETCRGKGRVWRKDAPDIECDCRTESRKELRRYREQG